MKKFFCARSSVLLLILTLIIMVSFSCRKVSELSDNNTIATILVSGEKPEEVVFDTPRIEDKKIIIPLRFGKYLFPLQVKLDIKTEMSVDKILGFDYQGYLTFESISSINVISVVAKSGMTSKYEVVLEELPSNDLSEVEKFTVKTHLPQEYNFISEALIDEPTSTVRIFSISNSIPFTIVPEIILSAGASLKDYKANDPITFETLSAKKNFKIVSESGREQVWQVTLSPATILNAQNESEIPLDVAQRLSLEVNRIKSTSQTAGVVIDTMFVSNRNSSITIFAGSAQNTPNASVKLDISTDKYSSLSGFISGESIYFKEWREKKKFYIGDQITGWAKEWTIEWRSINDFAEILNIGKNGYSSADGKVIIGDFTVNRSERTITIPVLEKGTFPLILNGCYLLLSSGAVSNMPSTLNFSNINDYIVFNVTKNDLSEQWKIVLSDNFTPKSTQNEVVNFITGLPSGSYLFSEKYLENGKSQIILIVENYNSSRQLKIAPLIKISEKAKLDGIVSGATIVLSPDKDYKFSVIAEDGTIREWKIKLIDAQQISNSDFETWGQHPQFTTIPLTISPSDGSGWNSSNNPSVQGLSRVAGYNSTYAAKLETRLSSINFANIIRVTSLASGSIFLGKFKYSILAKDVYYPQNMTKFGIPFRGKSIPAAFSMNFKYTKGANLVRTTPKFTSLNIPEFEDPVTLEGTDKAIVWIELWYHSGVDEFDIQKEPAEHKIARGEFIISDNETEWSNLIAGINLLNGNDNLFPTHVAVTVSSSKDGDLFTGSHGNTLIVDNFKLIYYIPGQGAIILN